jgi:UPF0755 protein
VSSGFWLRLKTIAGAALVYATVPLLVLVWSVRKLINGFRCRPVTLIVLIAIVPCAYASFWLFGSRGSAPGPTALRVAPGTSFRAFTDTLAERGLIRQPLFFRLAAHVSGIDRQLHVGLYSISPDDSPYRILRQLAHHEQVYLTFTVVEGDVLREFLPRIGGALGIPPDSLAAAVEEPDRAARLGTAAANLEGYLFPETYAVPWGSKAADVIDVLTAQFETVWARVSEAYTGPLTRHEAVTLASLIEAEARDGAERRTISSVFHNRLERRMKLQCDPTVIYAMGGLDRQLLRADWQFESPYNTYVVFGLPPGPICSPGEAALAAALYPETTDYLYFVARGDGTHQFSRTLAEHEAAFRAIQREAGRRP